MAAALKREARLEAETAASQLSIAKQMAEDERLARQSVLAKWEETEEMLRSQLRAAHQATSTEKASRREAEEAAAADLRRAEQAGAQELAQARRVPAGAAHRSAGSADRLLAVRAEEQRALRGETVDIRRDHGALVVGAELRPQIVGD